MRDSLKSYWKTVSELVDEIACEKHNEEAFSKAAELIADRLSKDELVYLVGPGGHSNMTTEETLCRAGLPVQLSPMIDCTNLIFGTTKTRFLQRSGNYAKGLLEQYYIKGGDVLIVVNSYGINYLCVDLALEARKLGAKVIAITSTKHCSQIEAGHPARHPSGQNLKDVVDVYLDSKMPFGDVTTEVSGVDQLLGPVSTIGNVFTMNMLMMEAVERLVEKGVSPKIWRSINLPGGDEYNKTYFHDYGDRIKYLL